MAPLLWIIVIISAYWLWPLYIIAGVIWLCIGFPSSGESYSSSSYSSSSYKPRRRTTKPYKHKPFKLKTRKRIVYKAPKYKAPKPFKWPKGRKLKDGQTQYMKTFGGRKYWTPKSRWKDRTD
jgi:hypothetical protein